MQCVWKEGGCELNPLCNMWLLDIWVMFKSARKFGESGTGFCVQSVYCATCNTSTCCRGGWRKASDEFRFEDIKLECVCEFAY